MSDKVFTYSWSGNNWDYRFLIYKASETELINPEYIELPAGCLKWKSMKRDLKRGIGIPSADMIEFTLNVRDIPLDFDNEIIDIIRFPVLQTVATYIQFTTRYIPLTNSARYNFGFKLGTVIKLQVSYLANNQWDNVFTGILRGESGYQLDNSDILLNFKAISIYKVILDNVPFGWLTIIRLFRDPDLTYHDLRFVYDLYFQYNNAYYTILQTVEDTHNPDYQRHFNFYKLDSIFDFIENALKTMYRKLIRDNNANFSLKYLTNTYYKNGDADGTKGAALNDNEIWIMVNDGNNNGLFNDNDDLGLYKKYNTSAWDFLNDYCVQSLMKIIFDYSNHTVDMTRIFGSDNRPVRTVIVDPSTSNISSENSDSYIYKASATYCDIWSDDKFKDTDKIEKINSGSTNENEFVIPMYFNSLPSCVYYKISGLGNGGKQAENKKPHVTNLFYKLDSTYMSRVYESVDLKNGITVNPSQVNYITTSENLNKPSELCAIIQDECGWGKVAIENAMKIYGDRELQEISLELPVDYNFNIADGWLLQYMDTCYSIDISEMDPRVADTYKNYFPIEWEWDFDKELIKLKLLQKRV
jgi:hypothetical protein